MNIDGLNKKDLLNIEFPDYRKSIYNENNISTATQSTEDEFMLGKLPVFQNSAGALLSSTGLDGSLRKILNESDLHNDNKSNLNNVMYHKQIAMLDPQLLMLKVQAVSMRTCTEKVSLMKESNKTNLVSQNNLEKKKIEEYKSQIEEQNKAEEQAKKSKILNTVFGWLGVAVMAVAAIFNPAMWAAVAVSAASLIVNTVAEFDKNAPEILKKIAGALEVASVVISSLAFIGSALLSKVAANTVMKITSSFIKVGSEKAIHIGAMAGNVITKMGSSIGNTINGALYSQYLLNADKFMYALQKEQASIEQLKSESEMNFIKMKDLINDQASNLNDVSRFLSQSMMIRSKISTGLA
ncbi:hypothetical protein AIG44_24635 [Salmonella enterica subsp. enterica serovar Bredeney]|nr:hypothetical protein [Salmonella enterica subsp. enterica serovar Bredeney]